MSCGFDKEIIQKYADNTIDPLELIFLKEHINYCGECRKELDLVMTLENQLDKFFEDDVDSKELDLMINKLVDDCMYELNRKEKLKYALKGAIRTGSEITGNSLRFVEYLPGSRILAKGIKKTASFTGNLFKSRFKKEAGKLLMHFNNIIWG